jgi:hypothetical protein
MTLDSRSERVTAPVRSASVSEDFHTAQGLGSAGHGWTASKDSRSFALSDQAQAHLHALVDRIEANPGDFIHPSEFETGQPDLNLKAVVANLPPDLSEDDFAGILKLALLTESATDTYSATINRCARDFAVPWLGRFNERVWSPDESTHHAPYKLMLLTLGYGESELDAAIRETREREYVHFGGETPLHVTTFGMIQEYLTDSFHGLIAGLLRLTAPDAHRMVIRIKRRETLHTAWYRDMTALQVEENPHAVAFIAEQIAGFHMPSKSLVPELHTRGIGWQAAMGADFQRSFKDLFRLMQETLGSVRLTGELVLRLAAEKGIRLGPLPPKRLVEAMNLLGGPGYGLIGEAALERAGLAYLFRRPTTVSQGAPAQHLLPQERIRGLLRSWIAAKLPPMAETVLGV